MAEQTGKPRPEDPSERKAEAPRSERRARHRVQDDQKSGQGSLSALSKLKMQERKRAAMQPPPGIDEDE